MSPRTVGDAVGDLVGNYGGESGVRFAGEEGDWGVGDWDGSARPFPRVLLFVLVWWYYLRIDESGRVKRGCMGVREVVDIENIEVARQLLIAEAVGHLDDERVAKKTAVRQLIGTLIGARTRGLSFERMAEIMGEAGVPIAPETLRGYYFELKTETELQEENRKHAAKLAKARRDLGAKELAENLQHAQEVAIEHVASRSAQRPRVNAFASKAQLSELARPVPAIAALPSRPEQVASPAPESSAPGGEEPVTRIVKATPRAAAPVQPEPKPKRQTAPIASSVAPIEETPATGDVDVSAVQARTIDEIATASVGMEVGELVENLHVREGNQVWCESGKPYTGLLKAKQVHLLRTVGRLIAPTVGRSSGDFVAMPRDL